MTTICVDAMGGDEKPEVVLEGIANALSHDPDLEVLVAGPREVVEPFCASNSRAKALVCTEVIGMEEHPAEAVRQKKDSTIVRGCAAVKAGEADGFFSAGSTGAVFTAATLGIGRIRGVKRPALSVPLPGLDGHHTVFLDMGANADVRPEVIVQFARMGRAYAQVTLGVEEPTVALLSNGTEDTKGSEAVVQEHALLAAADLGFVGNCEGSDLLLGSYDVIVTDGFSGNVALKSMEATAKFMLKSIKASVAESKRAALGALMLKPAIKSIADELSGDEYGGAVLLGVKAPVFIGHGATSARAVEQGTAAAAAAVRGGLVDKVQASFAKAD